MRKKLLIKIYTVLFVSFIIFIVSINCIISNKSINFGNGGGSGISGFGSTGFNLTGWRNIYDGNREEIDDDTEHMSNGVKKVHDYFGKFFNILNKSAPKGSPLNDYNKDECPLKNSISYLGDKIENDLQNGKKLSYKSLLKCLKISDKSVKNLKNNHKKFISNFLKFHEKNKQKLFNSKTYSKNSNGIVIVGGGKFSLMSFTMIEAVRKQGIDLPIEILIPPNDELLERKYCDYLEDHSKELNAKCIYFNRVFPDKIINEFQFQGYQYKSVAIVASSFQNVLLLDADNFPLTNITNIFNSDIFLKKGLIFWPDYWRRSTSPRFYEISNIDIDFNNRRANLYDTVTPTSVYTDPKHLETKETLLEYLQNEVPMHDFEGPVPDASSETGQLLVNKFTHMETILLSLYYNVYGPDFYYPLLSQGLAGQGDKETFIAAANFFKQPFYQVKAKPGIEGYGKQDGSGFRGVAIYQHDFIKDYERNEKALGSLAEKYTPTSSTTDQVELEYDPQYSPLETFFKPFFKKDQKDHYMFAHCNFPKFEPVSMYERNEYTWEDNPFRVFKKCKTNGFDLEKSVFTTFDTHLCHDNENFISFSYLYNNLVDTQEWENMCSYIQTRLQYLKDSEKEWSEKNK